MTDPHLLEALRLAVRGGEHRLFRSGKFDGLFRSRALSEVATAAVAAGLLEVARTETRGKVVTEWVQATPKAVAFVHDHDSPKSVLAEVRDLLAAVRSQLDGLTARVEAALRRSEAEVAGGGWVSEALRYLDTRAAVAGGGCPLGELFAAVSPSHPSLTLAEFHDGVRRLCDSRSLRPAAATTPPEFATVIGGEVVSGVSR